MTRLSSYVTQKGIGFREDAIQHRHPLSPQPHSPRVAAATCRAVWRIGEPSQSSRRCNSAAMIRPIVSTTSPPSGQGEPPFDQLSIAVQRQVVQRQLFALGVESSFDLVEALRLEAGRVIEVAPGRRLQRNAGGQVELAELPPPSRNSRMAKCEVSLVGQVL